MLSQHTPQIYTLHAINLTFYYEGIILRRTRTSEDNDNCCLKSLYKGAEKTLQSKTHTRTQAHTHNSNMQTKYSNQILPSIHLLSVNQLRELTMVLCHKALVGQIKIGGCSDKDRARSAQLLRCIFHKRGKSDWPQETNSGRQSRPGWH